MKKWLLIFSILILFLAQGDKGISADTISDTDPQTMVTMSASGCYAIDVVFLVDQSNSMSGITGGQSNDPLQQRINAPKYALDWLANNRLALCNDVVHRIGVVSFGTNAEIDLPMTEIKPSNQADWDSISGRLESSIQERYMDATNPVNAFDEAKKMFDSLSPVGTFPRKRVIILLTDGQPCVPGMGCTFDKDDAINKEYMNSMINNLEEDFPFSPALIKLDAAIEQAGIEYGNLSDVPDEVRNDIFVDNPVTNEDYENSTYIYIVAMNGATPYLNSVGGAFEEIADFHGGEVVDLRKNAIEVPRVFNDLLSKTVGITPTLLGCGNLAVDPYLSGAILDVFKVAEGLELEIDFNSHKLVAGGGDIDYFGVQQYSEFGANEHYRFVQPPAGLWHIDSSNCDGVEASFISFNPKIKLLEPAFAVPHYDVDGNTSDPLHPYTLRYQIVDQENGITLDYNPDYPLTMQAIIKDLSGTETVVNLEFEKDGEWVSKEPIPVNILGEYSIEIKGIAKCVNDPENPEHCSDGTFEVVNDSSGKYQVAPVSIFHIVVDEPVALETYPLHGKLIPDKLDVEPFHIQFHLEDESNTPINTNLVFPGDLNQAFTVDFLAEGKKYTEKANPVSGSDSAFEVNFTEPKVEGEQSITISLLSDYNHTIYRPKDLPVTVNFIRTDTLFRNPVFYNILLIIAIALVVAIIIKIIWDNTNVVKGALVFRRGPGDEVRLSVSKKKRVVKLSAKKTLHFTRSQH